MTNACDLKERFPSGDEDALVPLSALQHYLYCPRQCALIHSEREWAENLFTAEGRLLHAKADSGKRESRKSLRIETGVLLRSVALGLVGKADVVEYHRKGDMWLPFPVEYKRGRHKTVNIDRLQLCAQAICLEEMHEHGKFLATMHGPVSGNVLLRKAQYAASDNADFSIAVARNCISGKLYNCRTVLRRTARTRPDAEIDRAAESLGSSLFRLNSECSPLHGRSPCAHPDKQETARSG